MLSDSSSFSRDVLMEVRNFLRINLQVLKISRLEVGENFTYPPHRHLQGEIIVVEDGDYDCVLNGQPLQVSAGHLVLIQPTDRHEDFYRIGSRLLFIIFELRDCAGQLWLQEILAANRPAFERVIPLDPASSLARVKSLIIAQDHSDPLRIMANEKLGGAFFWELLALIPAERISPPFFDFMEEDGFRRQVYERFQERTGQRLDVTALAGEMGLSKRTLEYRFKRVFGAGPAQVFLRYKMRLAARLLEQGMSVKDTAMQLGFAEPFYFSTAFKRIVGIAPSRLAADNDCAKS